jgi:predicted transcriptional regulator
MTAAKSNRKTSGSPKEINISTVAVRRDSPPKKKQSDKVPVTPDNQKSQERTDKKSAKNKVKNTSPDKTADKNTGDIVFVETKSIKCLFEPRLERKNDVVLGYAETFSEDGATTLPAVKLANCSEDPEVDNGLLDGTYIIQAYQVRGIEKVPCQRIPVKDKDEAYELTLKWNCSHGQQLSRLEKGKAAFELSQRKGKKKLSQAEIGKIIGVHQANVSRMISDYKEYLESKERGAGDDSELGESGKGFSKGHKVEKSDNDKLIKFLRGALSIVKTKSEEWSDVQETLKDCIDKVAELLKPETKPEDELDEQDETDETDDVESEVIVKGDTSVRGFKMNDNAQKKPSEAAKRVDVPKVKLAKTQADEMPPEPPEPDKSSEETEKSEKSESDDKSGQAKSPDEQDNPKKDTP